MRRCACQLLEDVTEKAKIFTRCFTVVLLHNFVEIVTVFKFLSSYWHIHTPLFGAPNGGTVLKEDASSVPWGDKIRTIGAL